MSRWWGQTLFSGVQRQDKGQRAQTEAQEVPSEHKEELLYFEGEEALWILFLRRYSKPTWTRSCAACSRWTCFSRVSGLDDPQRSLPIPTILWFYDIYNFQGHKYPASCPLTSALNSCFMMESLNTLKIHNDCLISVYSFIVLICSH